MDSMFDFLLPSGHYTGWVPDEEAVKAVMETLPHPMLSDTPLNDFPTADLPKEAIINKFAQKVLNQPYMKVFNQGNVGSCVGHGSMTASNASLLVEIANGEKDGWEYFSRLAAYAMSRVNFNGGRSPFRSDGSVGAWSAGAAVKLGQLGMQKYAKYDLSTYSVSMCREWGATGVPSDLMPEAAKHKVTACTMVTTVEDAQKALANGYGLSLCSDQGFNMKRDRNGVCAPSGSWSHCLSSHGYLYIADKLYFIIENSWGDYLKGSPRPPYSNDGTFLASADVVARMLKQKDSFAWAGINGFAIRDELDWGF